MALIVQKFGGTSVGTVERIEQVAEKVKKFREAGDDVVVVVSAMSGETNRLIGLANQIMEQPVPRELDVMVSTGEQVTIALLSMALIKRGVPAVSYTGNQVRILTDSAHKARICTSTTPHPRRPQGRQGSGGRRFPGRRRQRQHHHAGPRRFRYHRGGLAAALKADECQIYTDVDGVYTTDPRVVPQARRLDKITFEEMLEMASLGSRCCRSGRSSSPASTTFRCACCTASRRVRAPSLLSMMKRNPWNSRSSPASPSTATKPS